MHSLIMKICTFVRQLAIHKLIHVVLASVVIMKYSFKEIKTLQYDS